MIDPNVALMTAPIPMELCAEIDATAMPMKYDSGMTDPNAQTKMTDWLDIQAKKPPCKCGCLMTYGSRKKKSKMVKPTKGKVLTNKMLTPPTVYL